MVDNDVTVRLLLRDEMSAGLKRAQAQVDSLHGRFTSLGNGNPLVGLFDTLDGKAGNLTGQLDRMNTSLARTSGQMRHGLVYGLRDLTLGLTAAAGAATFFGLRAVNSFQHTQAAFSTLTGSMANGQRLYNQLMQLNLQSPFDMQPLAQSAQTLLGFGFTGTNVMPLLRNISNVAAVQQDPNEALTRMALAVGQINQSGTVRAQDLNQLVQAGLPAYSLIPGGHQAIRSGNSMSSAQFIQALSNPSNPQIARYGGAAAAMNNTLSGQWSNLTTEVRQTAIGAFQPLANELVKEMPGLTRTLQGMTRDLAPGFAAIGDDLVKGIERVLPVLEPLVKEGLHGLDIVMRGAAPFVTALQRADPQIVSALDQFFTAVARQEPQLAQLFGELVQLLPLVITDLTDLIPLVTPLLDVVDGLLKFGPAKDVVGGLLTALLAYKTLSGPIGMVLDMKKAIEGLTGAQLANTAVAEADQAANSGGGGLGGRLGRGGIAKNLGTLLGVGILGTSIADEARGHWGVGNDVSMVTGGAMTGARFGPFGALAGGLLGGAWAGGTELGRHLWGHHAASGPISYSPSQQMTLRALGAVNGDPGDARLQRLLARDSASVSIQSGAITVNGAQAPAAVAQAVRAEIERWVAEQQTRP